MSLYALLPLLALIPASLAQVTASFPNGATNPAEPSFYPVGSFVNQTSLSRLLTLNGVDDFCLYGPPESGTGVENEIGSVEPIVVAYCTKPRNGARLIPDGAITGAHFIKTPLYVQIHGFWDGTKVNIVPGDAGGELDPHGAENLGNPIGGNVTSNVGGTDVFYEEWMSFISYDQFCLRICTAETGNVTTALQCEHELDIMGCQFVMAIENFYQSNNTFSSCEGAAAAPPGLYPLPGGGTSTFRQRYTGTYTDGAGSVGQFTVGQTVTPSSVAFYPATSNCVTYSTISNGVDTANFAVTATPSILSGGSTVAATGVGSTSQTRPSGASSVTSRASSASASASASGGSASASASRSGAAASGASGASAAVSGASSAAASSGAGPCAMFSTHAVTGVVVGLVGMLVGAVTLL
ncbi:hypothetical protein CI109_105394 [Kwoniella shandongensis]|uniref:Uncharacterized protein n=1 Tax=Kwoniella shandongensis TaxID=1734106 RepID=A0A5M6BQZ9_9TREE|nr:uncharacterized protein CI109_006305 [Kwoniella shandongensis]KAA5525326.1 hypothetical protein CI109_006305 [Kwoniella shandongensis]